MVQYFDLLCFDMLRIEFLLFGNKVGVYAHDISDNFFDMIDGNN